MGRRSTPRPSWALAYISRDWKRKRTVAKAYKLASADDDDLTARPSDEVLAAVVEARARLAVYVRLLDQVLELWEIS